MKIGDKVKSHLALWKDCEGTIDGIIKRENNAQGDWIHVIFPETDRHYGFMQSFNSKDLILIRS